MKILFVTLRSVEINSSVSISNLGILRGLLEDGHEIDLMMPTVNHKIAQFEEAEDILNKVNVIRIDRNTIHEKMVLGNSSFLRKNAVNLLRKFFYFISIHDNSITLLKSANVKQLKGADYDLVISTSDPKTSHIFVDKLIKQGLDHKLWIQHWGDPLTLDITSKNIYPRWYIKHIERKILAPADKIIYVSPITKNAQQKLFDESKEKMDFIPLPAIKDTKNNFELKNKPNKNVTIGYFGDYNSKVRDILPLYNFCANNEAYNLIVAGSSDLKLISRENIKIYPRLKQHEISRLEKECDVLAIICNKKGTQIPGKIYYYSSSGKPLLTLLDGDYKNEIKDFLEFYNRFMLCENDENTIGEKLDNTILHQEFLGDVDFFSPQNIAKEFIRTAKDTLGELK